MAETIYIDANGDASCCVGIIDWTGPDGRHGIMCDDDCQCPDCLTYARFDQDRSSLDESR